MTLCLGFLRQPVLLVMGCVDAPGEGMLRNPLVPPGPPVSHLSSEDLVLLRR